MSILHSGKSRKHRKDPEIVGTKFGIQMIVDQFGDGWHKSIMHIFGGQSIAALLIDAVT